MILSRIAQQLRQQNWTAVAIELVIVVLGVFIGMQVSNWNAAQADKRLGRVYAERLAGDLRKDLTAHRELISYYNEVIASIERTGALLSDPRSDPKQLVLQAYRATEVASGLRTRATWDEIVSSGDTGLLPRAVTESGIADYYARDSMRSNYEGLVESGYRKRVRQTIPTAVQKAIRAGCSDVTPGLGPVIGFAPTCTVEVDEKEFAATAAALRADPLVAAELRYQYSLVVSSRDSLRASARYIEAGLAALGSPPVPEQEGGR